MIPCYKSMSWEILLRVVLMVPPLLLAQHSNRPIQQHKISEPYRTLYGYNATGNDPRPNSPDPSVRYTWDYRRVNGSEMQLYYTTKAEKAVSSPTDSFSGIASVIDAGINTSIAVHKTGSLMLDFGVERASWFEFVSHDLSEALSLGGCVVTASISEYNQPWPGKTMPLKQYDGGIYRLETNSELYEGVRFAWINYEITDDNTTTWHIDEIRLLSQIRPVEYTGSFEGEALLEKIWYTGAYGTRLNMHEDYFGSILMNRGDRVSIQGDGHPTMAAALVAFGSRDTHDLVWKMLNKTDSGCPGCHVVDDGIMAYPVYWTMSVNDWYLSSGNSSGFLLLSRDMENILEKAASVFLRPGLNIGWFGWDDRIGNGFCGECNREARLGFAALLVRAHYDYAATTKMAGQTNTAEKFHRIAQNLSSALRGKTSLSEYGLHAGANLVNAGATTASEDEIIFAHRFNDTVTLCSWSNFNQFWNLQALGNMGKMDHALAMARLCWGEQLRLGNGCFWELFSPEWNRIMKATDKAPTRPSYCHPWANGVTPWLTKMHIGINPLQPGYRTYAAMPFVSRLNPRVGGSVYTQKGPIRVWANCSDLLYTTVKVDAPVPGIVGVPRVNGDGCRLKALKLNGEFHHHQPPPRDGIGTLHSNIVNRHCYTSVLPPGFHVIHAEYSGCQQKEGIAKVVNDSRVEVAKRHPMFPPYGPAVYPVIGHFDRTTKGSWIGKYGKEGYVLFGFDNGKDVSKLPAFVGSLAVFRNSSSDVAFVGSDAKNVSYLQDPRGESKYYVGSNSSVRSKYTSPRRALGFVTKGPDGSQGTVLDINVTTGVSYQLALYAVANVKPRGSSAWSASRQAIRVLDLKTMDVIAPTPIMEHFDEGAYYVLSYDRGVRLRVMPIDNDAGFSAIFFDAIDNSTKNVRKPFAPLQSTHTLQST